MHWWPTSRCAMGDANDRKRSGSVLVADTKPCTPHHTMVQGDALASSIDTSPRHVQHAASLASSFAHEHGASTQTVLLSVSPPLASLLSGLCWIEWRRGNAPGRGQSLSASGVRTRHRNRAGDSFVPAMLVVLRVGTAREGPACPTATAFPAGMTFRHALLTYALPAFPPSMAS